MVMVVALEMYGRISRTPTTLKREALKQNAEPLRPRYIAAQVLNITEVLIPLLLDRADIPSHAYYVLDPTAGSSHMQ